MSPTPVNNCYLVNLVLIVAITASAFGIALVSTDKLSDTYKMHFNWTETE